MSIEFLYQDEAVVVVTKPAELLSVPGKGPEKQDCLWKRVQQQCPTARIVHRLDFATSGLMVLGLTADSHRELSRQFQQRETSKRYQAVIHGIPTQSTGSVELPLRCDWERRPLQMVDHEQGKHALTHWEIIEEMTDRCRVLLHPITGRSHQLRVHMQAMGHPILGDYFYACDEALNKADRLLLHSDRLGFKHPTTGIEMNFSSECPF